jgi:hypothetical protein
LQDTLDDLADTIFIYPSVDDTQAEQLLGLAPGLLGSFHVDFDTPSSLGGQPPAGFLRQAALIICSQDLAGDFGGGLHN